MIYNYNIDEIRGHSLVVEHSSVNWRMTGSIPVDPNDEESKLIKILRFSLFIMVRCLHIPKSKLIKIIGVQGLLI